MTQSRTIAETAIAATAVNPPVTVALAELHDGSLELTLTAGRQALAYDPTDPADRAHLRSIIATLTTALWEGTDRLEAPTRVHPPALDTDGEPVMPKLAALMAEKPAWGQE